MFVGHFGVAFAAKRVTPRTNVGVLVLAAEFVDLLWPIFLLLGIERVRIEPGLTPVTPLNFVSYPWTHSLLMTCVWGIIFASIFYLFQKDCRAAFVLAVVVVSHWFLDYATHIPDLPLVPGHHAKYGLGLWNSRLWTAVVELAIYIGGIAVYVRSTRSRDRIGSIGLALYIAVLTALYAVNLQGSAPPSVTAVAVAGIIGMPLFVLLAWWIDRHRVPVS